MLSLDDIRARLAKHQNLRAVARQTGLAYQTVYGVRSGRLNNPRLSTMTKLSDYLEALDNTKISSYRKHIIVCIDDVDDVADEG